MLNQYLQQAWHAGSVPLSQALIRYPSLTPDDALCLRHMAVLLEGDGWAVDIVSFEDVINLYATYTLALPTENSQHLCFAGHVDVVTPGDVSAWTHDPFAGTVADDWLWGRGVADMKGAIACFLTAFHRVRSSIPSSRVHAVSLLLTSDEEGEAEHGLKRMVPWLQNRGHVPTCFLIGEPTGTAVGQVLQIGRRGSVTGTMLAKGVQGHIAYPHQFDNPVSTIVSCSHRLMGHTFDAHPDAHFEPTRLEITSIDTNNPHSNVIWSSSTARFGVRFNPQHTGESISQTVTQLALPCHTATRISGEPYLTTDAWWIDHVQKALTPLQGHPLELTTRGGITDGRFLIALGPVVELGLPETTIHAVNERVALADFAALQSCYEAILTAF
jgi:succinyl-diaminopimelate desuccinylase